MKVKIPWTASRILAAMFSVIFLLLTSINLYLLILWHTKEATNSGVLDFLIIFPATATILFGCGSLLFIWLYWQYTRRLKKELLTPPEVKVATSTEQIEE